MSESKHDLIDDISDFSASLYSNREYTMDEMISLAQNTATTISMESEYVQVFYQEMRSLDPVVEEDKTVTAVKKMFLEQYVAPVIAYLFKKTKPGEHKTRTFEFINESIMQMVDYLPPMLCIYFGQLALNAWLPLSEERKAMREELTQELVSTLRHDKTKGNSWIQSI